MSNIMKMKWRGIVEMEMQCEIPDGVLPEKIERAHERVMDGRLERDLVAMIRKEFTNGKFDTCKVMREAIYFSVERSAPDVR